MISEDLYKKLLDLYSLEYCEKESEHENEKLNLLREAINNFDSYTKGDAYWILDGISGLEQDHWIYAQAYHKLYEELNEKRHEKWGDDCEP